MEREMGHYRRTSRHVIEGLPDRSSGQRVVQGQVKDRDETVLCNIRTGLKKSDIQTRF